MAIRLIGVPFDGRAVNALKPQTLAILGPRDEPWQQERGVETVAGHVLLRNSEEVAADPAGVTRSAIESISSHVSNWWLHTDLDVLSERDSLRAVLLERSPFPEG